ncbi:unnamed protein product [Macrosiphum euphorbiae]|uniref:RING-type E3 ubiquitin transferase n=1 Tax=Macrosiphum euphorbiae TaxID=13131 RepID=A0AAV0XWI2_9HEMI|nr:unnamed protein product [Macrosiphum euphorbiae]
MDILNNEPTGRPSTPDPQCSICLNDLTNKCYSNACVHLFCFDCLQLWSNMCLQRCPISEPTCPLCKQTFKYIFHSFDNLGVFETYTVPIMPSFATSSPVNEPEFNGMTHINSMIVQSLLSMTPEADTRLRTLFRNRGLGELGDHRFQINHNTPQNNGPVFALNGQSIRMEVYNDNVWAIPLHPNTDGRFRYGTTDFYRNHPTQMYRLRTFILRDLVAIRESVRVEGLSMPFPGISDFRATNLIMSSLPNCDIRQLHLLNSLNDILNVHADPFYQEQPPPNLIVLDSNNEELQRPNIIEDSSSTNSSDVEVLSEYYRSIDPQNSASINQPSTSTGIRDSLDGPKTNNSFQSINGGLSQVSYSSQVKRGRPDSDESDDEESIIATQESQTANLKSQDINNKKKKKHQ